MDISIFESRALKAGVFMVALALAVISHAVSACSEETTSPPSPWEITDLRPGKRCQIWLKTPAQAGSRSAPDAAGTIQEVTKDEIVVSQFREGRNERRTPVLGSLPLIGKYSTKVEIGREEITSRIPRDKIARIKILEPDQVDTLRR